MKLLQKQCHKAGCEVLKASVAEEGLRLAKENDFDFIMSDIGLPDYSGFALAQKIHSYQDAQVQARTPIIGLTAHAQKDLEKMGENQHFEHVYQKPLSPKQLDAIIEQFSPKGLHALASQSELQDSEKPLSKVSPYFDPSQALRNAHAQAPLLRELVQSFVNKEMQDSYAAIQDALRSFDYDTLLGLINYLNSACVYSPAYNYPSICVPWRPPPYRKIPRAFIATLMRLNTAYSRQKNSYKAGCWRIRPNT